MSPGDRPLLELREVSLGYAAAPAPFVVHGVSFVLEAGEFLLIEGENGSGKTTLLRGLLGLVPRSQGLLRWSVAASEVGYVPQEAALEPGTPATALDVVRSADPAGWRVNREEALALLDKAGLSAHATRRFWELSGGQRRRVLFARALLGKPKVLLLDEPTANVDAETEATMEAWIEALRAGQGTAVLAITHSPEWAPAARRLRLRKGVLQHA
jgi:ABC-type Mn2+/Zn2+ transport system ATPase subunit